MTARDTADVALAVAIGVTATVVGLTYLAGLSAVFQVRRLYANVTGGQT